MSQQKDFYHVLINGDILVRFWTIREFTFPWSISFEEKAKGSFGQILPVNIASLRFGPDTGEKKTAADCGYFSPELEHLIQIYERDDPFKLLVRRILFYGYLNGLLVPFKFFQEEFIGRYKAGSVGIAVSRINVGNSFIDSRSQYVSNVLAKNESLIRNSLLNQLKPLQVDSSNSKPALWEYMLKYRSPLHNTMLDMVLNLIPFS